MQQITFIPDRSTTKKYTLMIGTKHFYNLPVDYKKFYIADSSQSLLYPAGRIKTCINVNGVHQPLWYPPCWLKLFLHNRFQPITDTLPVDLTKKYTLTLWTNHFYIHPNDSFEISTYLIPYKIQIQNYILMILTNHFYTLPVD